MNGAKRAEAELRHAQLMRQIKHVPQGPDAPWANDFPVRAKVRISPDVHVFSGRTGIVMRHCRYGAYVLLDLTPREHSVKYPLICPLAGDKTVLPLELIT